MCGVIVTFIETGSPKGPRKRVRLRVDTAIYFLKINRISTSRHGILLIKLRMSIPIRIFFLLEFQEVTFLVEFKKIIRSNPMFCFVLSLHRMFCESSNIVNWSFLIIRENKNEE